MRTLRLLALLALSLMACTLVNFQVGEPRVVTATPDPFNQLPTITPMPTFTPAATATPVVIVVTSRPPVNTPPCYARTDLYAYIVQPGDTLNKIAARTGSTVAQIAAWSCVANPDRIEVGQVLYVARAPIPVTSAPYYIGQVAVSPVLRTQNGMLIVRTGSTVQLSWNPGTGSSVRFLGSLSSGAVPAVLGTDSYIGDGGQLNILVNPGFMYRLSAEALDGSGRVVARTAYNTVVVGEDGAVQPPIFVGQVGVSPILRNEGGLVVLEQNRDVVLSWSPGVGSQIRFYYAPTGTGMVPTLIGTDTNASDGGQITWRVPPSFIGHLMAESVNTNGTIAAYTANYTMVMSEPVGPVNTGEVGVSPILRNDGGTLIVQSGSTVTLSWNPGRGTSARFFATTGGGSPVEIGSDGNLSDGAQMSWVVTSGTNVVLSAEALSGGNVVARTANATRLRAEDPGPPTIAPPTATDVGAPVVTGQVDIAPIIRIDGSTMVVAAGGTVTLTWNPGVGDQISFFYAPIMSGAPGLIGTDGFAGDGGSLTWTVPADANGYLSAEVTSSDGRVVGYTAGITAILAE